MKTFARLSLICCVLFCPHVASAQRTSWIATWAASPQPAAPNPKQALANLEGQTVRERIRVSIGGEKLCIRLSNEFGTTPLQIGSVTVAVPVDQSAVAPGSIRAVTFGGQNSIVVPAGAPAISDPVAFSVKPGEEISISIYFPARVTTPTLHHLSLKRAVVSQKGDHTRDEKIEPAGTSRASIALTAVFVPANPSQRLLVAFGDSITDGDQSTFDADRNWPTDLIRRISKTPSTSNIAVANEGIVANRLLSDCFIPNAGCFGAGGLSRFDRDALAIPGVTHIVLLEGINDICFPGAKIGDDLLADAADMRTAEDLIAGYRQLISRAHARGIKIIGATITPFEGVDVPGYYSEAKEAIRQAVNKWIRTSGTFNGVIDFDAVLRDPDHPTRISPKFASQDHLHPNDAGYQAMADAIDLNLFR
jgi:lysophospholipase L1-like esterase